PLAPGLRRAAGFRNRVGHMYDGLDMARVFRAAREGPADLGVSAGAAGPRANIVGEPFVRKAGGTCRSRRREQPLIRSRIMAIPSRDVRAWPSLHARGEPVEPRAPVWRLVLRQAQDERCTAPRS